MEKRCPSKTGDLKTLNQHQYLQEVSTEYIVLKIPNLQLRIQKMY